MMKYSLEYIHAHMRTWLWGPGVRELCFMLLGILVPTAACSFGLCCALLDCLAFIYALLLGHSSLASLSGKQTLMLPTVSASLEVALDCRLGDLPFPGARGVAFHRALLTLLHFPASAAYCLCKNRNSIHSGLP